MSFASHMPSHSKIKNIIALSSFHIYIAWPSLTPPLHIHTTSPPLHQHWPNRSCSWKSKAHSILSPKGQLLSLSEIKPELTAATIAIAPSSRLTQLAESLSSQLHKSLSLSHSLSLPYLYVFCVQLICERETSDLRTDRRTSTGI